jgi:HSP20 family protein
MIFQTKNGHLLRDSIIPPAFSSVVDNLLHEVNRVAGEMTTTLKPATDIIEKDGSYELHVSLPGLTKEDIKLEVKDSKLTISGEKKTATEEKAPNYLLQESFQGKYSRSFKLPENSETEKISAQFKDGILNVTIPASDAKKGSTSINIE